MNGSGQPIYLDHLASTPLDPAVRAAMLPWLEDASAGNPHSRHAAGWRAAEAVEQARGEVAALIGARPSEIFFTSGGTEANNLALLGIAPRLGRVVTAATEHPSVLEPARWLSRRGVAVEILPVDRDGGIDLAGLERSLGGGPALVSLMAANNEIGTLHPLADIGRLCRARGAIFHTDAAQALSTQPIDVRAAAIDLLTISSHKLHGPAGIGALYLRTGVVLEPILFGGGQQDGRRPGTLPVALCVGMGAACRLAANRRGEDAVRIAALRERLWRALQALVPGIERNGPVSPSLPGCLNVTIPGIDAADLLLDLPELAISTGAACSSLSGKPSHVLAAIGRSPEQVHASLRFGLGRGTTAEEIDRAAAMLAAALSARIAPPRRLAR